MWKTLQSGRVTEFFDVLSLDEKVRSSGPFIDLPTIPKIQRPGSSAAEPLEPTGIQPVCFRNSTKLLLKRFKAPKIYEVTKICSISTILEVVSEAEGT